jgi:hypothetical protein
VTWPNRHSQENDEQRSTRDIESARKNKVQRTPPRLAALPSLLIVQAQNAVQNEVAQLTVRFDFAGECSRLSDDKLRVRKHVQIRTAAKVASAPSTLDRALIFLQFRDAHADVDPIPSVSGKHCIGPISIAYHASHSD